MAIASVVEWRDAMVQNGSVTQVPRGKLRVQNVTFSTSTPTPIAMGEDCGIIQVVADAAFYWEAGASPTATTASAMHPAHVPLFFACPPGGTTKLAFLAV